MHVGATLGRRFTLMRSEAYDLPGVERFVAHDNRLNTEVIVDIVTSAAPSAVRSRAARSTVVRDRRIARVIATGREQWEDGEAVFVVSQSAAGLSLDTVLETRVLPASVAGSIVANVARALAVAHASDVHHGHLRPSAVHVDRRGSVVLTGVGIDGELAVQASLSHVKGDQDRADAVALGQLYVAAVTGIDIAEATVQDIPSSLSTGERALCSAVIHKTGPQNVTEIVRALPSSGDPRLLRTFAKDVDSFDLRPALVEAARVRAEEERLARLERIRLIKESISLDPAAVTWGATIVESWEAMARLAPGAWSDTRAEIARLAPATAGVAVSSGDGFDLFEEIREEQTAQLRPAVFELLLDRLHSWWPRSEVLTKAVTRVHHRAQRSGPIKAGPLLMATGVVAVVVAAMVAFSMMEQPFEPDFERFNPPANTYPPFTFSPPDDSTISPTASPSPADS